MKEIHLKPAYAGPYTIRYFSNNGRVRRSFWIDGYPIVVELEQTGEAPVSVRVSSDRSLRPIRARIEAAVRHIISADEDVSEFHQHIARDKAMAGVAARLPGLKPLRSPDLWTTLLRSLTSQQISIAAARSIENKLATRFGHMISIGEERVPVLPDPATLLSLKDEDIRGAGYSGRKVEYARSLAEHVLDGTLEFERLRASSLDEVIETMTRIRGVGRWTAECTALFALGHRDVLPADDLGIRKGMALMQRRKLLPSPKDVKKRGERWAGWRSFAAIYLWRSLDAK
jgi:DNA-3-methyladenine glycosylase II